MQTLVGDVLVVLFVSLGLVGRVALQLWWTGDTGLRFGARSPAAAIAGAGLVVGMGLVTASPALPAVVVPPVVWGAGAVVAAGALAAMVAAQVWMGASWRIGVREGERSALVVGGPFRWVRNPIFSALIAWCGGMVLVAPSVVSLVGLAVVVAALELQVRGIEEPHLVAVFGDEYLAWAARTGRFVPGLGQLSRERG